MKEFFGWGGYTRPAEGFMSWQHLLFVSLLMALMLAGAVYFGRKYRHAQDAQKNRVLAISAILVDAVELFKIVIVCLRSGDAWGWRYELPLFMCSILLIAMPVAAFSKGRLREAALDFVLIFGLLGAVLGTYGAGNNYSTYPVLSFDNLVSGITHALSGFASLYIGIAGMAGMKKRNIPLTISVLMSFVACALVANRLLDYNYMFLARPDGTPYAVLYAFVGGHPVLYPLGVIVMFLLYIEAFYGVYYLARANKKAAHVSSSLLHHLI